MKGSETVAGGGGEQLLGGPWGVREYGRQNKNESFILNTCYVYIMNCISDIWEKLSIEGI